jgi:Protein of unknown function (DUF559)
VITGAQLRELGFTRSAIAHREREGRLWRVHRDVFAVGRRELTREGEWMAAVLACGGDAALSHLSAAILWGIWKGVAPRWPHVSVPTYSGRRAQTGIRLHRTATLIPSQVTVRNNIPVTTLDRTLLDHASWLNGDQLKRAIRQAERLHRLDLDRLLTSLDALPKSDHRRARLAKALETYVPQTARTEGDLEPVFLELCAEHGIPLPTTQVEIGPYRADFLWPDLGLVVEIDDRESHDTAVAFVEDRKRDRFMFAAGLAVLRFARVELVSASATIAAEIRTARARRAAHLQQSAEG